MLLTFWRKLWQSSPSKSRSKRTTTRPRLEILELRCVPSTWQGTVSESWSDPDNWDDGKVPGKTIGDKEAIFSAVGDNPCELNIGGVKLDSLHIDATYTETIYLKNTLTLATDGQGSMEGGVLLFSLGRFVIQADATMVWRGGIWSGNEVARAVNNGTLNVVGDVDLNVDLTNNGNLTINGGNVTTSRDITNNRGGRIDFQWDNSILADLLGAGTLTNEGKVTKSGGTGTFTLDMDFTSSGSLNIKSGTLYFKDTATQTAGGDTTIDHNMTLQVKDTYLVEGGLLTGTSFSTVIGNLKVTGGDIIPGGTGRLGRLLVTNNYEQTGGSLFMDVDAKAKDSDLLDVQNTATLGGTLEVNTLNGPPTAGQKFSIVSYGALQGDFANAGLIRYLQTDLFYKTLPAGAPKTYQLQVVEKPKVKALLPNQGPAAGGTTVSITGEGFTDTTSVSFGGTPAMDFSIESDSRIVATSPAHSPGTVDVTVTNDLGTSDLVPEDHFTYLADPPPTLTLSGTGFSAVEGDTSGGPVASLTSSDPNAVASDFTGTATWSNGSTSALTFTSDGIGGFTVAVASVPALDEDEGGTLTLHITGSHGDAVIDSGAVFVSDAALSSSGTDFTATALQSFAGPISLLLDDNTAAGMEDFTGRIVVNWGDDTPLDTTATVSGSGGHFTISGTHVFATAGTFDVTIFSTDQGGSSTVATAHATVAAQPTTLTLSDSPGPVPVDTPLTYTVTVTSTNGVGTPTGGVLLLDDADPNFALSALVDANGSATFQFVRYLGTHHLHAIFSPDSGAFASSVSNVVTQEVTRASTVVTLSEYGSNPSYVTGTAYFKVLVSSAPNDATGLVYLYVEGQLYDQHGLFYDATADQTYFIFNVQLPVGEYSHIYAIYEGDEVHFGGTSNEITHTVIP